MTRRLWKASTSLALILLVAFGARLAFAWDQERKIPDTALAIVFLVRRRSEYTFPLAAYPVVFPFLYYITHTSLRYRHPIDPVALLLTAIAAQALWCIVRPRQTHPQTASEAST